jgi:integrase
MGIHMKAGLSKRNGPTPAEGEKKRKPPKPKIRLTDRKLRSQKPAPAGERYFVMDAVESRFGVRIGDTKGDITFIIYTRMPGSTAPVRRTLGKYPSMGLAEGRAAANAFKRQITQGIDPREAKRQQEHAVARAKANTFAHVLADFAKDRLATQRKGRQVERALRRELGDWMDRPVAAITTREIRDRIKAKRVTPYEAKNLLAALKLVFGYAVDEDAYGIEVNPAAGLKPSKLIGETIARDRVLSDDELRALWMVASELPYPVGPAYRVLMLTALRLNEAARASWSEFDLVNRLWVVPTTRMKGKNGRARPHAVPLTDDLMAIINELPPFKGGGEYLFSTTKGEKPVSIGDKIKNKLDARMLEILRGFAAERGDDPAKLVLTPWRNHDIRRTIRTHLSRIPTIDELTREALLAHVRAGVVGIYDRYDRLAEKHAALTAWAARLRSIVEPVGDNVVHLRKGA